MIQKKEWANLIPLLGILTFVGLYIFSSNLYPGGSQADLNSDGFDWINNYWCNLVNENGMNGQANPARSYSILALVILCLSLMVFFIQFTKTFVKSRIWKQVIILSGILSMSCSILIFTAYHDLMTILASVFGFFVVIGIIRTVYQNNLTIYKFSGAICIVLLGINNYIYYFNYYIEALPLLQKIAMAFVLIWISGLNFEMIKRKGWII